MRWKDSKPVNGEMRARWRFVWWPLLVNKFHYDKQHQDGEWVAEWVWMERIIVLERYQVGDLLKPRGWFIVKEI
jgi:hypothetical protein